MRLHPPPGRAGRLWLRRRLAVAERGREVLEQKRRALLRRRQELATESAAATAAWEEDAREAAAWWQRAAILAGERPLRLAAEAATPGAEVRVTWRNALGTVYPADVDVELPAPTRFPAGGSAALAFADDAHRHALASGARAAMTGRALAQIEAELARTTERLRAIDRRWIPAHEEALHGLELALEESEREDAVRVRWVAGQLRR